jgi:hypothetical protein
MPFERFSARPFKLGFVQREAPAASGVYGLSNAAAWIFVGETANIQASLLDRLRETGPTAPEHLPTGFTYELCPPEARVSRQRQLMAELGLAPHGLRERV